MHSAELKTPSTKTLTIALLGNPNCGKSTVFNQLTGLRQKIGNFPGVTVDKKLGQLSLANGKVATLIDLPGTYNLYPTSQDERVVLNILANPADEYYPDAILYIADVTQLEKHFLLFSQVKDLGIPMVLALNMSDAAAEQNLQYDTAAIAKAFKVPTVAISGRLGENFAQLKAALNQLVSQPFVAPKPFYQFSEVEKEISHALQNTHQLNNPFQALLWAQNASRLTFLPSDKRSEISTLVKDKNFNRLANQVREVMQRFDRFTPMLKKAIQRTETNKITLTEKIDNVVTHRFWGPIIFFVLMLVTFQAIYAWSSYPMDMIEAGFASLTDVVNGILPDTWYRSLLTDGIIAGLGGILIFIPQIAILFLLISILEEVGYMARAVFMFDNLMQRFGMNGRSIVALVSSGACAIPAVMSTRTISNWKERLITILVAPFISCSARIPVYTVLIGFVVPSATIWGIFNQQGIAFMGLYLVSILAALGSAWVFKKILKTEERSFLMLELPEYRKPVFKNVLFTVYEKVKTFVIEAGKVIFVISIVLWVLASYGPNNKMELAEQEAITIATQSNMNEAETADLVAGKQIEASYAGHLGKFIEPAIRPLGYDWKIGIALITSLAAREVFIGTMATIYSIGSADDEGTIRDRMAKEVNPLTGKPTYNFATSLSLLVFYIFAMMCMSTLAVVKRETGGWKWPIIQFVFMTGLAYLGAFVVYQIFA
ncbi:MAG: ferrous iron transport protein B [Saprospiraceae bacterium]